MALNTSDIFEYFRNLDAQNAIPPIEVFEKISRQLYHSYTSTRGLYHAFHDAGLPKESSDWTNTVPTGSPWTGLSDDPLEDDFGVNFSKTTLRSASRKQKLPKKTKKKLTKAEREVEREKEERRENGDHVLANSIAFMRDTLLSRECANAVTSGDVGRVWEVLKVSSIIFYRLDMNDNGQYV